MVCVLHVIDEVQIEHRFTVTTLITLIIYGTMIILIKKNIYVYSSENVLDAKYLQRSGDPPVFSSNKPTMMNFGPTQSTTTQDQKLGSQVQISGHQNHKPASIPYAPVSNTRLNKDLILPRTAPSQPTLTHPVPAHPAPAQTTHNQPPLASSYFPSKGQWVT